MDDDWLDSLITLHTEQDIVKNVMESSDAKEAVLDELKKLPDHKGRIGVSMEKRGTGFNPNSRNNLL